MAQLNIDFEVHARENNVISQAHLDKYRHKFAQDTFQVLSELVKGRTLDYKTALNEGLTGDLRRRVKDIRDMNIPVSDEWVTSGADRKYKQYFMTDNDKITALKVLITKSNIAA